MYLDHPRLHFSGQFYTNVSTINNTTANYDRSVPRDLGWNPNGLALYRIVNGTVGGVQADTGDRSLVGATVRSTDSPNAGKLVDIDPEQQALSQVIGVRLHVQTAGGAGFTGTLRPCNLQDMWRRALTGRGKAGGNQASAVFISVLDDVVWTGVDKSAFLKELEAATSGGKLSIRFIVDSYFFGEASDPASGFGRVVGTIGPFTEGQPVQFVTRRLVLPPQPPAAPAAPAAPIGHDNVPAALATSVPAVSVQACGFLLDSKRARLTVDLGNSIQYATFGGSPVDVGQLRLASTAADGTVTPLGKPFAYTAAENIGMAGVLDLALTAHEAALAAKRPVALQLQASSGAAWTTVLAEDPEGRCANVAPFTMRVVAGEVQDLVVQAFQWGRPFVGQELTLTGTAASGTPAQLNIEGSAGPGVSVTDRNGLAAYRLVTVAPTLPPIRKGLDSIVYLITGPWVSWGGGQLATQIPPAALLVWAPYPRAGAPGPTWEKDVLPIFTQYMTLYPGMKQILDLTDRTVVEKSLAALLQVLSLPFEHPGYMPVIRDLSPQKVAVIKTWIHGQLAAATRAT